MSNEDTLQETTNDSTWVKTGHKPKQKQMWQNKDVTTQTGAPSEASCLCMLSARGKSLTLINHRHL